MSNPITRNEIQFAINMEMGDRITHRDDEERFHFGDDVIVRILDDSPWEEYDELIKNAAQRIEVGVKQLFEMIQARPDNSTKKFSFSIQLQKNLELDTDCVDIITTLFVQKLNCRVKSFGRFLSKDQIISWENDNSYFVEFPKLEVPTPSPIESKEVYQTFRQFREQGVLIDVTFVVGEKRFPAHKLLFWIFPGHTCIQPKALSDKKQV